MYSDIIYNYFIYDIIIVNIKITNDSSEYLLKKV
jgi:hypothetical protein